MFQLGHQKRCSPYERSATSKLVSLRTNWFTSSTRKVDLNLLLVLKQVQALLQQAPLCSVNTTNTSSLLVLTCPKRYSIYACRVTLDKRTKYPSKCTRFGRGKLAFFVGGSSLPFSLSLSSFFPKLKVHLSFPHVPQDGNRRYFILPLYFGIFPHCDFFIIIIFNI